MEEQMNDIFVSFVVPVYNGRKYIEDCIRSIEKNDGNFEILLIDDGSTDGSSNICDDLGHKYRNINVVHNKNHGVSFSRNFGIKKAVGKYVAFVDQDDYIASDFVDTCKKNNQFEPDAVYFKWKGTKVRNEISEMKVEPKVTVCSKNEKLELIANLLHNTDKNYAGYTLVFPWGGVYKREFLLRNNIEFNPEVLICEDVYFNISVLKEIDTVLLVNSIKYFYFCNIDSAGNSFNPKADEIGVRSNSLIKDVLGDLYDNKQIQYCYAYSVIYRYWWAVVANYYHIKNKQSIIERANSLKSLHDKEMYQNAFGYVDEEMLMRMDNNMRIIISLVNNKKYFLASIVCKGRIIVKKLKLKVCRKA